MKTERIEACIEYVRHMETYGIGQRDPNKCGATDARAELAVLKEEYEALKKEVSTLGSVGEKLTTGR